MERPTPALHLSRIALDLRQLRVAPHTKEVGRYGVCFSDCLRSACCHERGRTIDLPSTVKPESVRIALDARNAEVAYKISQAQPFVAALSQPLRKGSVLIVSQGEGDPIRVPIAGRPVWRTSRRLVRLARTNS
jgi:hypothetical protein